MIAHDMLMLHGAQNMIPLGNLAIVNKGIDKTVLDKGSGFWPSDLCYSSFS